MENITARRYCLVLFLLIISFFTYTSCIIFTEGEQLSEFTYRFSIKNESNTDLSTELIVGEIPSPQAGFDELTIIPDEIYKLVNKTWSPESTYHLIKPKQHDAVYSNLPIVALFSELTDLTLKENMLDRYFSFILTIRKNDEIIYRIVGWDVPDEDMVKYQITDKSYGYYYTTEENYRNHYDGTLINAYPNLFTKLWPDENNSGFNGRMVYYIKVTGNSARLYEFGPLLLKSEEDKYWKKN